MLEQTTKFDTFFVAYISVLGYFLSYLYQLGFFHHYNISPDLLVIDLTSILFSISATGTLFVLPVLIFQFFSMLGIFHGKTQTSLFLTRTALIVVGTYLIVAAYGLTSAVKTLVTMSALFIFLDILLPHVTQRDKTGFEAKLKAHEDFESEQRKNDFLLNKVARNRSLTLMILGSVFLCVLTYGIGEKTARDKEWYMVSNTDINTVILKSYNNYHITSEYDPVTRKLVNSYSLIHNNDALDFRIENLKGLYWK